MTQVTISFPGLGIGEFTIDKIAFSVGSLSVRWYGIILTLGILCGVLYAVYRAGHEGIRREDVLDYALWVVLLAVIGARLYYVLTTLTDETGAWNYHSLLDMIAIWKGGIAIYGAVLGGALGIILVSKVKKFDKTKILKMFDMIAPGVMLGQIIGRWGNFVNGEAHGVQTSESFFLRMGLMGAADGARPNTVTYFHPTFLYESLWNLVGFVLINLFYRKKKYDGQILLMYLAWYGFGRMLIEGLRTDSLYIGVFRISQVVGFLCFVICTTLLVYFAVRNRRKDKDKEEYTPVYENLHGVTLRPKKSAAEQSQESDEDEAQGEENEEKTENTEKSDILGLADDPFDREKKE